MQCASAKEQVIALVSEAVGEVNKRHDVEAQLVAVRRTVAGEAMRAANATKRAAVAEAQMTDLERRIVAISAAKAELERQLAASEEAEQQTVVSVVDFDDAHTSQVEAAEAGAAAPAAAGRLVRV